jgi:hypothetical protein
MTLRHRLISFVRQQLLRANDRNQPRFRAIWNSPYRACSGLSFLSKLEKGASYPGLEIIATLAAVLEVEPAELLRVPPRKAGTPCAAAKDVAIPPGTGSGARSASYRSTELG